MTDRTYSSLLEMVEALSGVNAFTSVEKAHLVTHVNRRAYVAYHASAVWPRFLVAGEQRALNTGTTTIPYTESGKDDIGEFLRVFYMDPTGPTGYADFEFYVDANGAHIVGHATIDDSPYVAYKKNLPTYTSSSTNIPGEWFYYMAYGAYADMLRMDLQHEKAIVEERRADEILAQEMSRQEVVANENRFGTRFLTPMGFQFRLY